MLERTEDGGRTWKRVESPDLNVGERGAFAASNSSLALARPELGALVWIGTGGPGGAMVLSETLGADCSGSGMGDCKPKPGFVHQATPLQGASASQGVFSLAVRAGSGANGPAPVEAVAVGGDYSRPDEAAGTAAYWTARDINGGWRPADKLPAGYRSAVAWDEELKAWITAGPSGSDLSVDGGRTWLPIEHAPAGLAKGGEWNALSLPWVVGPHGRIAKLNAEQLSLPGRKVAAPAGKP